ncbi:hypothetical protein GCM10027347_17780 [Larkinella harenae]
MDFDQIYEQLLPVVEEIAHDALERFKDAIREKRLVLTEELERNFRYELTRSASMLALQIEFRGYGRFKDMARTHYGQMAPPEEMEEFVKHIGLDRFAYVQGYRGHQVPTVKNAIKRLAFALAKGRRKARVVKRGYKGTWYNSSKMKMINQAKRELREKYKKLVTPYLAKQLEGEK